MSDNEFKDLREELTTKRGEIYTDQLSMSVGELINLYKDEEIELEPAFQRLFRWSEEQETNFIESILLGYPIPSIFVVQKESGIWDVIDGVQRLSTIYHFAGVLRKDKVISNSLQLKDAKILTLLKDKFFIESLGKPYLDSATRIDFKRAVVQVVILKSGSDPKSKFELFKRLNTGGTHLSHQEMRNSMILMYNEDVFNKMNAFSNEEDFKTLLNLPESYSQERMDMDILTRFLVMRNYENIDEVPNNIDINDFLDEAIEDVISKDSFDIDSDIIAFRKLLNFIKEHIQKDYGFRVYDNSKKQFVKSFNWFVFEVLIWGSLVINDIDDLTSNPDDFEDKIKNLISIGDYKDKVNKRTIRVIERLKEAKKEAEDVFGNE